MPLVHASPSRFTRAIASFGTHSYSPTGVRPVHSLRSRFEIALGCYFVFLFVKVRGWGRTHGLTPFQMSGALMGIIKTVRPARRDAPHDRQFVNIILVVHSAIARHAILLRARAGY